MNTIQELVSGRTDGDLSRLYGRDRSYWCHVRRGKKKLSRPAALAIWRADRVKLGPLAGMADSDIDVLARLETAA